MNRSLKLCHPLFPPLLSHTTNPLSAVFLSWSQIPPSSPLTKPRPPPPPPPPPPPSFPRHCQKNTNTALCCADYRDILIKSDLKGRSHCERVNPHRSFTLFKQIRRGKRGGLYPFRPAKSDSFFHKGGNCNCADYRDGDSLLSLYQQGSTPLQCNKRKLGSRSFVALDLRKDFGSTGGLWLFAGLVFAHQFTLTSLLMLSECGVVCGIKCPSVGISTNCMTSPVATPAEFWFGWRERKPFNL